MLGGRWVPASVFGGAISITGITLLVYSAFLIVCLGYLMGRVRIAGVGLGAAGVFRMVQSAERKVPVTGYVPC